MSNARAIQPDEYYPSSSSSMETQKSRNNSNVSTTSSSSSSYPPSSSASSSSVHSSSSSPTKLPLSSSSSSPTKSLLKPDNNIGEINNTYFSYRSSRFLLLNLLFRYLANLATFEANMLFSIQQYRKRIPRTLRRYMDLCISSHPLYDLSFIYWLSILLGLYYIGYRLMWIVSINILLSFLLAWTIGGSVPNDNDLRLRPRGRVSPNGFPCIELQITASFLYVLILQGTVKIGVIFLGYTGLFILILLRLYGLTHYPHQLFFSVFVGTGSVPLLYRIGIRYFPRTLHPQTNLLIAIAILFLYIGYLAYKMETNDAPIGRIPKDEFMQVLTDIMKGDDATISQQRGAQVQAAIATLQQLLRQQQQQPPQGSGKGFSTPRPPMGPVDSIGNTKQVRFEPGIGNASESDDTNNIYRSSNRPSSASLLRGGIGTLFRTTNPLSSSTVNTTTGVTTATIPDPLNGFTSSVFNINKNTNFYNSTDNNNVRLRRPPSGPTVPSIPSSSSSATTTMNATEAANIIYTMLQEQPRSSVSSSSSLVSSDPLASFDPNILWGNQNSAVNNLLGSVALQQQQQNKNNILPRSNPNPATGGEDEEDDDEDDGISRPARDSFYYLLRSMEQRKNNKPTTDDSWS